MAGPRKLTPLVGICLLLQLTAGQQQEFSFPKFEATGDAHLTEDGEFWLTDYRNSSYGAFRYAKPFRLCDAGYMASFVTDFTFKIDKKIQTEVNADGLAFTIAPGKLATSNATYGRWLGAFSPDINSNASNNIVAVEFDTYKNMAPYYPEFNDIDDNHVGLDLRSISSANQSSLNPAGVHLGSGNVIEAKIDYNAKEQRLRVYVSYNLSSQSLAASLILDHTLKLCAYIEEESFVGFSAGSGVINLDYHKLLSWNFTLYDPNSAPYNPRAGLSQGRLAGIVVPTVVGALGAMAVAAWLLFRKRQEQKMDLVLLAHEIPYHDLVVATDNFSHKNLLGEGGFGSVFKGQLARDKSPVAVKRMSAESRQGEREFIAEVTTISQLSHRNLVKLRGWCKHKKQLILVYDFMPGGSVHNLMFGDQSGTGVPGALSRAVPWETRHHILCGIAAALLYLHEEWEKQVVHRDVKLSNVLLDADMNARLGDFGLARTADHGLKLPTTTLAGTLGYIAPEIGLSFKFTAASDTFSFGVVVLEMVTGRVALAWDALLPWVQECVSQGKLLDVVDNRLENSDHLQVLETLEIGLACTQLQPENRPKMREVLHNLLGYGSPSWK